MLSSAATYVIEFRCSSDVRFLSISDIPFNKKYIQLSADVSADTDFSFLFSRLHLFSRRRKIWHTYTYTCTYKSLNLARKIKVARNGADIKLVICQKRKKKLRNSRLLVGSSSRKEQSKAYSGRLPVATINFFSRRSRKACSYASEQSRDTKRQVEKEFAMAGKPPERDNTVATLPVA